MSIEASGPNAEMITYWNDRSGEKWVLNQAVLDSQIEPLGRLAMERAGIARGERVIDVGCGCGQSCLQLGELVGDAGSVLGVDISAVMLERARARAGEAGQGHVSFVNADAQTHAFEPASADLVFSRFGVMFFAEPAAAFENLRTALTAEGRLAFVCWQGIDRNPWMLVPVRAAVAHLAPPPPPEPGAPGPFSLADPQRVREILGKAGFHEVAIDPLEQELEIGAGLPLDEVIDFLLQLGPLGALLRQAGDEAETLLPKVREAVREAVLPYYGERGLRMAAAGWIVTARAG